MPGFVLRHWRPAGPGRWSRGSRGTVRIRNGASGPYAGGDL